ncbi:MAG: glycosyltransferase [Bacteroidales bacterium]|nr:glycosyltransferase [Bacteroidales bacterium]
MNVNHIVEDYSIVSGGVRTVVENLNNRLNENGYKSRVFTTEAESNDSVILSHPEGFLGSKWRKSKELENNLKSYIGDKEIVHTHGVWMFPQYYALKMSQERQLKSVFSPHGMLEPWLWKQGYIKKKIYFNLFLKKNLLKNTVIHAITPAERDNLNDLLPGNKRIEVIPNLISLADIPAIDSRKECKKYILFLGRIHKKKGIDLLIKAFSKLKDKNTSLKIAGAKTEYQDELVKLVKALGLQEKVEFCGMVTGTKKYELFRDAHVFAAPSFSEVVGMVNLEAAIMKTPVITTHQTGLLPQWSTNGGRLINPDEKELYDALVEAVSWDDRERNSRGEQLYEFVKKEYSWEHRIESWKELYTNI